VAEKFGREVKEKAPGQPSTGRGSQTSKVCSPSGLWSFNGSFPKNRFSFSPDNAWFVQIGDRQIKLAADKDEAFTRYTS